MSLSGGGASRVHSSTTRHASFTISVNVLLMNLIQGVERLQIPPRAIWFIIPSQSNHGSGGSGGGTSCPSLPKGVTISYQSTNISNSIAFGRWDVSYLRFEITLVVRLHLCLYLKILLFIQFISYILYNVFANIFVFTVYIVYFISFFFHETILIYIICIFL